jgi:hypothetical protein
VSAGDGVRLPESTLREYRRFSLYNSPYPAHDSGRAIDLYPATNDGISPVAGTVVETKTVRAPDRQYAHDEEYLILVEVDVARSGLRALGTDADRIGPAAPGAAATVADGLVARVLHVRPAVEPGDVVAVGDSLGEMIRSGFFAPWVANHVHLGFRRPSQNPYRADGSIPVVADVAVEPVPWDGVGTVVETGETYAILDAPTHPAPGERFAGISGSVDDGPSRSSETRDRFGGTRVVLDGGFAHYAAGGVLGDAVGPGIATGPVSFLGHPVGDRTGRDVAWRDVDVLANGERITGLSLFAACDPSFGAKLVCPDREFAVGERVRIAVEDSDDPVRLG